MAALLCLLVLPGAASAQKPETKIRGFITALESPNAFEVGEYHVTRSSAVAIEFQDAGPDVTFRPEDFRIGLEVEVRGAYNEQTGELQARKLKIDLDQLRRLKQTVVLSSKIERIERIGDGWRAVLFAGGRNVKIEPSTRVEFGLSNAEREDLKRSAKAVEGSGKLHTLSSLEEIVPGNLMTFEGRVAPDGSVLAERVEFRRNELEKNEEALWKLYRAKIKTPRADEKKPATLKVSFGIGDLSFKLLPQDIQDYLAKVGNSLVPAYQRALPEAELTRIRFQFYAVEYKDAFTAALPSGTIIVTSAMFDLLENEAQLAALLGRNIAHIVQKHHLRQMEESTQKRFALALGRVGSYSRLNEIQADRLSLEYLHLAGYDLSQAVRAWQLIAANDPESEVPITRRTSLMVALFDTYPQYDSGRARKNEEEFRQIAARIRQVMAENLASRKK